MPAQKGAQPISAADRRGRTARFPVGEAPLPGRPRGGSGEGVAEGLPGSPKEMQADVARLTLGLIQMNLSVGVSENLAKTDVLLQEAARQGASLALLPEMFPLPWVASVEDSRAFAYAEPEDGPTLSYMRKTAKALGIALAVPLYERCGEQRFNTTFVISPYGDILMRYRKNHIPYHPGWYEKYYYEPGDLGFPVFHHMGSVMGVQTCWDNLFPEGSRILALKGAEIILAPRGSGDYSRERWRTSLAANAMANNCFVATVNRIGRERGGYQFGGDSLVVGPDGEVVASTQGEDVALTVEIDLDKVRQSRGEWPFLADRRPSLYREICEGPR